MKYQAEIEICGLKFWCEWEAWRHPKTGEMMIDVDVITSLPMCEHLAKKYDVATIKIAKIIDDCLSDFFVHEEFAIDEAILKAMEKMKNEQE